MYTDVETTEPESMYSTNSFNDNNSGGFLSDGTKIWGDEYFSPWDIWYRDESGKQPAYTFWNGNVDGGGEEELAYSPYELRITPYVGLAYFDGDNDGFYTDLYLQLNGLPNNNFDFTTGNYPNLYDNNDPLGFPQEVGALINADPIVIPQMQSARFENNDEHLPSTGLSYMAGSQMPTAGFTFNNGLANGNVSQLEIDLLREYGKVFFYRVEVFENGNLIDAAVMHPNVETLHTNPPLPHWKSANDITTGQQMVGYDPTTGNPVGLFFYYNNTTAPNPWTDWDSLNPNPTGNHCNSREVVFRVLPSYNTHIVNTGSVTKTLYMGFTMHPFYFWQASSLSLRWI